MLVPHGFRGGGVCYNNITKILAKLLSGIFFQKAFKNPYVIIDNIISPIVRKIYNHYIKVDNNKILLSSFSSEYTCNPKAIANEIIRRNKPWKLVWSTNKNYNAAIFPENITLVRHYTLEFFREAASSKIWISNGIVMTWNKAYKKNSQILIQTWHGAIGIKRFDTNKNKKWIKKIKKDGANTNYCISNSTFETQLFKNTFWKNAEILEYGHARNDVLFNKEIHSELNSKIRSLYNIPEDVKLALYAPTFRDDYSLSYYDIDYEQLRETLTKKFGGEWIILYRLHDRIKKKRKLLEQDTPDYAIDVSAYEDIQDIMAIIDVGITDYSSWICEFILTKKPGFLFATDIKSYDQERGFLFPLAELPYTLAENNDELMNNILNFEYTPFKEKCEKFLQDKGSVDDGNAAKRIVDFLETLMEKQN